MPNAKDVTSVMFRRSLLAGLVMISAGLVALPTASIAAAEAFPQEASSFVSSLGEDAIHTITAKELNDSERVGQFHSLFVKGFDIPAIARFVLGRYWRTATPEQQQEFTKLFEAMVVQTYANRFRDYSGQQLKVTGAREEGDGRAIVSSQIINPNGGQPIRIDWRVAHGPDGDKIYDVIVEGVSMSVTEQQDFGSVIQRTGNGVDGLIAQLRDKYGNSPASPALAAEHGVAK
jgi:phospholipid transport system substrate-binding protein